MSVDADRGNAAVPEHQRTTMVTTPFSSSCVVYQWRRLWGVAEPIQAAWAAAAKVRLSVSRSTGLVAARVGNRQRGLLWVVYNRRRLKSIGSGSGTSTLCYSCR